MPEKEVSVIVPVYKVEEELLRRCIESLRAQTLREVEILLVDDGCPRGGGDICEEYARGDGRIRVLHQPNQGVSAARNTGMDAAAGRYLTFVDADDFVEPEYCRVLWEEAEAHAADIVSCRVARCGPEAGPGQPVPPGQSQVYDRPEDIRRMTLSLLRTLPLNRQDLYVPENHFMYAHLYRPDRLDGLRCCTALRGGEDKYFNLFALQKCRVFCRRTEALYHYTIRVTSATNRFDPEAVPAAMATYALYRELPEVRTDPDYRSAYAIRTCCMALAMAGSHFWHPDNPDKAPLRAFRALCRQEPVAGCIREADLRRMRPCKMKAALLLLKAHLYAGAARCARAWRL